MNNERRVSPELNDRIYRLATHLTEGFEVTDEIRNRNEVRDALHTLYLFAGDDLLVSYRWIALASRSGWSLKVFRRAVKALEEMGLFTVAEDAPPGFLKGVLSWAIPEEAA